MIGAKAQKSVCLGIVKTEESSVPCVPEALMEARVRRLGEKHRGEDIECNNKELSSLVELWEPFHILAHPYDTVRCAVYKFL